MRKNKQKLIILMFFILVISLVFIKCNIKNNTSGNKYTVDSKKYSTPNSSDYVYLSDIPYYQAKVGWGNLTFDKTSSGAISLYVNGSLVNFEKGIFAHATSYITYDLTDYSDYAYLTTYYGVNTSSGNKGNGVVFYIHLSNDNVNWVSTPVDRILLKSGDGARYAKIDVRGYKYVKLAASDNGSNGNDHSVWADTKLIKEGYNDNVVPTVEEYDEEIRNLYNSGLDIDNENLEKLILERHLVNQIGNYQLKQLFENPEMEETWNWLVNEDVARLRLFVAGGNTDGSWLRTMECLNSLYQTHKEDLSDPRVTSSGVQYKTVYLKMMFSIALTHGKVIQFYFPSSGTLDPNPNISDPVLRYEVFKKLFDAGKLDAVFETLEVEEMRYVMNQLFSNDEIEWLNDYTTSSRKNWYLPYSFITYHSGIPDSAYRNNKYYGESRVNYEKKYKLTGYDMSTEMYYPKNWIFMDVGGQCWQVGNMVTNIIASHGVPSMPITQPKHTAYLAYSAGGSWTIYNDAKGWDDSTIKRDWMNVTYGMYSIRYIAGWGDSTGPHYNLSYLLMGQSAINNYDSYVKSLEKVLLANSFTDTSSKERIYWEAIDHLEYNFDAWLNLVKIYKNDRTKTDDDVYKFIVRLTDSLTYFPLPMVDLLDMLDGRITDSNILLKISGARTGALTTAKSASWSKSKQADITRFMAAKLLGEEDTQYATFSFNNNVLNFVANSYYQTNVSWDYSLDGGETWRIVNDVSSIVLTPEEATSITPKNGILVHIIGLDYSDANKYLIHISSGAAIVDGVLYANENEGLVGLGPTREWRYQGDEYWTSGNGYVDFSGRSGDVVVEVRHKAVDQTVAGPIRQVVFKDVEPQTPKYTYMPLAKYGRNYSSSGSLSGYPGSALLFPNGNMGWAIKGTGTQYALITLDEPAYISKLQSVTLVGKTNSGVKKVEVATSLDGTNFTTVKTVTNGEVDLNASKFNIVLDDSVYAKYIRFYVTLENGEYYAGLLNPFHDTTKVIEGISVSYTTIEKTKEDIDAEVTVRSDIEIIETDLEYVKTNADGSKTYKYHFTDNEVIPITYKENNEEKTTNLIVDWIDKTPPEITLKYNTKLPTKGNVTVQLLGNEVIRVKNNGGKTYRTFEENGSYEFEVEDVVGNKKYVTAVVDNIDHTNPKVEKVTYSPNSNLPTADGVMVTIEFSEKVDILTDGDFVQLDDYTYNYFFERNGTLNLQFQDKVANQGSKEITVDWIIEGAAPVHIDYDILQVTDQNVVATISSDDDIIILNNNKEKSYTFIENGEFVFWYQDSNGNKAAAVAEVNWIDKDLPLTFVNYNIDSLTNKNVIATFESEEEVIIKNNDGKNTYTFDENGEFDFIYETQDGIMGVAHAKVDWIDKEVPTADIKYSTSNKTNNPVTATLINESENITILNNKGKNTYTFTKNGKFTFEFKDKAGNIGYATATVDWIEDKKTETSIESNKDSNSSNSNLNNNSTNTNKNENETSEIISIINNLGSPNNINNNKDKNSESSNIVDNKEKEDKEENNVIDIEKEETNKKDTKKEENTKNMTSKNNIYKIIIYISLIIVVIVIVAKRIIKKS